MKTIYGVQENEGGAIYSIKEYFIEEKNAEFACYELNKEHQAFIFEYGSEQDKEREKKGYIKYRVVKITVN